MGQTLSYGVYLPNEGERNCYAGLASNWQILNTAVGNIAEKAPLVHTHGNISSDGKVGTNANMPLITGTGGAVQAGSFGNQANTFCEGNDSRLSDARTPVAHTHTKSDVTDLLNSNFIPSANNSYDLGSSSYQWNNLYAKNYYYNGVAWGLDKANVWSANNEYKYLIGLSGAEIWFKHPNIEDITANPDANISKSIIQIYNKAVTQYFGGISDSLRTDGSHRLSISCFGFPLNSYAGYYPHTFYFEAKRDGTASFSPNYTNASLGTSTNKWKTLNGINPGALSLPNGNAQDTSWIGDLTIKDGSGFNLKTFALNGWITINIPNTSGNLIVVNNGCGQIVTNEASGLTGNNCSVTLPVVANVQISILLVLHSGESVKNAIFAPCLGNV